MKEPIDAISVLFDDAAEHPGDGSYPRLASHGSTVVSLVTRHGRRFAFKSMSDDCDKALISRLLEKEFNLLVSFDHPGIVRAYELCDIPGLGQGILMDYIDGLPLDVFLSERRPSLRQRRSLSRQLLRATAYLHRRGICHRDLKPSNVLIDNCCRLRLIDFGLGDAPEYVMFKRVAGTAGHVAPEVQSDTAAIDWKRADVYALGRLLRMLNAGWPYNRIAAKALRSDHRRRYADAAVMSGRVGRVWRWVAVVATAMIAISGVAFFMSRDKETVVPVDVNFAIIRGRELVDEERYNARQEDRPVNVECLSRQLDSIGDIGCRAGWTATDDSLYRSFTALALSRDARR